MASNQASLMQMRIILNNLKKGFKMLDIKLMCLANFELGAVVHVGKLETIVWLNSAELSDNAKQAILAILNTELENMATTDLLKKLAK